MTDGVTGGGGQGPRQGLSQGPTDRLRGMPGIRAWFLTGALDTGVAVT